MRVVSVGFSLAALLAVAACANNPNRPTDVGSMQTPTSYRPGQVDPTMQGRDVGSMQQPTATGGFTERPSLTPDTGNMALPPRAQGNSIPGRISP